MFGMVPKQGFLVADVHSSELGGVNQMVLGGGIEDGLYYNV
jgi:hypothetical protein